MGCEKAFIEIGGRTLLARQIEVARKAGASEIFISGRADGDYSTFGCRVLSDQFQNAGPLAGIERALDAASAQLLLVLAVDMPNVTAESLRSLATGCGEDFGAIPRIDERIEPLAAFYPKLAGPIAVKLLKEGHNAAKHFAESCVNENLAAFVEWLSEDARIFENWNSLGDLARRSGS